MGNTNAEKWTEQDALDCIEKVYQYNVTNKGNYHLGYALIELGYYPELWAYFAKTFKESKVVFKGIKKVEGHLEGRIVNSTMSGDAKSAAMAIFLLKNKYGYEDATAHEIRDYKTWADKWRAKPSSQTDKSE